MGRYVPATLCSLSGPRRTRAQELARRVLACQEVEVLLLTRCALDARTYRLLDRLAEVRLGSEVGLQELEEPGSTPRPPLAGTLGLFE